MNGYLIIAGAILTTTSALDLQFTFRDGSKRKLNLGAIAGIGLMIVGGSI